MWVEIVVGSRPCSEGFSPGSPVFLPPQKPTFPNSIWNQWSKNHSVEVPLQIPIYLFIYLFYFIFLNLSLVPNGFHGCLRVLVSRKKGLRELNILKEISTQ